MAVGEPAWIPIESVIAFNRQIVEQSGEVHSVRDLPSLQKAIAHPWNVWVYFMDSDIAVLSARLFTSIATARGFEAGNKRTSLRTAVAFVEANGYVFGMPAQRHPIDRLFGFFDGRLSQAGVVAWFRMWMEPR